MNETPPTPEFRLLTDRDLAALPEPEWTIDGILPAACLAVLYGQPGDGKSFLALDMALTIATQPSWHGYQTARGPVVYVAAGEGAAGLSRRVAAWRHVHDLEDVPGALFVTSAVQLHAPAEVIAFCKAVNDALPAKPALIVLDTLARCFVGGDENSAKDMGLAIAGADYIRQHTGAAVLLPHHPQKSGDRERGSSALFGAADTVWQLKNDDGVRILEARKQKDAELFETIRFALQPVRESCVVAVSAGLTVVSGRLTTNQRKCLETLRDIDIGTGVASGAWLDASGVPKPSFHRTVKQLVDAGCVEHTRRGRYHLLPAGAERLSQVSSGLRKVS